jgi:hypothetical protein
MGDIDRRIVVQDFPWAKVRETLSQKQARHSVYTSVIPAT